MNDKIFTPNTEGIFQIPNELYQDHVKAPEMSRSMVVRLLSLTPAHIKGHLDGTIKRRVTKAMEAGTLADLALLEPDKFGDGKSHYEKPAHIDLRDKEGIAWAKDRPLDLPIIPTTTDGVNVISIEDIHGMIASIMHHKSAKKIVELSIKQESAFKKDSDTGVLRKVRPDARLIDTGSKIVLGDLKTIYPGGAADRALQSHVEKMGYYIQDAFYSDVYKDMFGEMPFFLFFVVERKPPYAVRVFQIHKEGREKGREDYKRALETYAKCKETGIWQAYSDDIEIIRLSRWKLNTQDPVVIG